MSYTTISPSNKVKTVELQRTLNAAQVQARQGLLADLIKYREYLEESLERTDKLQQNIFAIIRAGTVATLQSFLEAGVYSPQVRQRGSTPLHVATEQGRYDMCSVLLLYGADVFARDEDGMMARDVAHTRGDMQLEKLLINVMEKAKLKEGMREKGTQDPIGAELLDAHDDVSTKDMSRFYDECGMGGKDKELLYCNATENKGTTPPPQTDDYNIKNNNNKLSHSSFSYSQTCMKEAIKEVAIGSSGEEEKKYNINNNLEEPPSLGKKKFSNSSSPVPLTLGAHEQRKQSVRDISQSNLPVPEESYQYSNYCALSDDRSLIICLVGLPGRGKSFIGTRIKRYLNWEGVPCMIFNAGQYRRLVLGAENTFQSAFFDPNNTKGKEARELMARKAVEDMLDYIGNLPLAVGILDATNTTISRRESLQKIFREHAKKQRLKQLKAWEQQVEKEAKKKNTATSPVNTTGDIQQPNLPPFSIQLDKVDLGAPAVGNGTNDVTAGATVVISTVSSLASAQHPPCEPLSTFDASLSIAGDGNITLMDTNVISNKGINQFNSLNQRRRAPRIVFIESICTDEDIITENILRAKCGNEDFKNVTNPNEVIKEFQDRISQYKKVYEPVTDQENHHRIAFIKIINVKQRIILHKICAGLPSRVAFLLMNLHPVAYPIYICRPGETLGNARGQFGGDKSLTPAGVEYALKLHNFIKERVLQTGAGTGSNGAALEASMFGESGKDFNSSKVPNHIRVTGLSNDDSGLDHTNGTKSNSVSKFMSNVASIPTSNAALTIICGTDLSTRETLRIALQGKKALLNESFGAGFVSTTNTLDNNNGDEDLLSVQVINMHYLDDLNYGLMEGLTESEARKRFPKIASMLFVNEGGHPDRPPMQQSLAAVALKELEEDGLKALSSGNGSLCVEKPLRSSLSGIDGSVLSIHGSAANDASYKKQIEAAAVPSMNLSLPRSDDLNTSTIGSHSLSHRQINSVDICMPTLAYNVSFPRGESYWQCNVRLENVLFELLRSPGAVLVLATEAPAKGILAFCTDVLPEKTPEVNLPLHVITEVRVKGPETQFKL